MEAVEERTDLPEFTVAMRGYDRVQVDEYIVRVNRWAEEARARQDAAEAEVAAIRRENEQLRLGADERRDASGERAVFEQMSDTVREVVDRALIECDEMRGSAQREAEAAVALARQTAVDIVSQARAAVAALEEAAEQDRRLASTVGASATAEAETAAAARLAEADETARARLREAEEEAAAAVAEAGHRRAAIIEAAEQHRRAVEDEIARLIQQRDHVLAQLANLRAALEGAIAVPDDGNGATVVDLREAAKAASAGRRA